MKLKILFSRKFLCLLVLGLGIFYGLPSQAQFRSFEYFDMYSDPKALGQGNAYTALSKSFSSLYYNPANLESNGDFRLSFHAQGEVTPTFGIKSINAFKNISQIVNDSTKSEVTKLRETQLEIQPLRLSNGHARFVGAIMATWKSWGMGLNAQTFNLDTSVGPDTTQAYVRTISDFSLMVGKSFSLANDQLWIGAVSRLIYRLSLNQVFSLEDLLEFSDSFVNVFKGRVSEGLILDFDVGVTYTPDIFEETKLRFSAVFAHIGNQIFLSNPRLISTDFGPSKLVRTAMRGHFGVGVEFPKVAFFKPSVGLDIRNLGLGNGNFFKHVHFGVGLDFPVVPGLFEPSLRAGVSQGYASVGGSLNLWWINIDVAYYAEEMGARAGQNPDRRLVTRFLVQI